MIFKWTVILFLLAPPVFGEDRCEVALERNVHPQLISAVSDYARAESNLALLESRGEGRALISIIQRELLVKEQELIVRLGKSRFQEILESHRDQMLASHDTRASERNAQVQKERAKESVLLSWKVIKKTEISRGWHPPLLLTDETRDGGHFIAYKDDKLSLFNARTGQVIRSFGSSFYQLESLVLSPNGDRFAAVSDGSLYVWDIETGQSIFSETVRSLTSAGWKDNDSILAFDSGTRELLELDVVSRERTPMFSVPYKRIVRIVSSERKDRIAMIVQYDEKHNLRPFHELVVFDRQGRSYGFIQLHPPRGVLQFSPDSSQLWIEQDLRTVTNGAYAIPAKPQSFLRRRYLRHKLVEVGRAPIEFEVAYNSQVNPGLSGRIIYRNSEVRLKINGNPRNSKKFYCPYSNSFVVSRSGRYILSYFYNGYPSVATFTFRRLP